MLPVRPCPVQKSSRLKAFPAFSQSAYSEFPRRRLPQLQVSAPHQYTPSFDRSSLAVAAILSTYLKRTGKRRKSEESFFKNNAKAVSAKLPILLSIIP